MDNFKSFIKHTLFVQFVVLIIIGFTYLGCKFFLPRVEVPLVAIPILSGITLFCSIIAVPIEWLAEKWFK